MHACSVMPPVAVVIRDELVMNEIKNNDSSLSTKELIVRTITKQGAWAIVAIGLLLYVGWQLQSFGRTAGEAVTTYVTTSTANIAELQKSTTAQNEAAAVMATNISLNTEVLKANQEMIIRNSQAIAINTQALGAILKTLEEAREMMRGVPAQREEQTKLLREIRDATSEAP